MAQRPLPRLIKQPSTYKLIVPEKVEEKIRYLVRKFPHTEWSGVLFYTHVGTFEKGDLVITCEDIFPMDLGNATFTDFKMSSDVASYIAQNIELFDCDMGLSHSHHVMQSTFSGTDLSTLQSEGNDTNCFVSLIVNTAGIYSAAVTRKVKSKKEITTTVLGTSYEFFGDGEIKLGPDSSTKETTDEEVIEYYMLDVERHEVHNPLAFLDERFEEIENKKQREIKVPKDIKLPLAQPNVKEEQPYKSIQEYVDESQFYDLQHPWEARKQKVQEPYLFDDATMDSIIDPDAVYTSWTPDKNLIHNAVCKMVSCSLILNVERFDLRQWVTRHMNNVYGKLFPSVDDSEFVEWVEFAVGFFVYHLEDPSAPKGISDEWYYGQVANAMIEELIPYNDDAKYPYIGHYINELSAIIV